MSVRKVDTTTDDVDEIPTIDSGRGNGVVVTKMPDGSGGKTSSSSGPAAAAEQAPPPEEPKKRGACCKCLCKVFRFIFKFFAYLIGYILGFVFLIVTFVLHLVFRIAHTIFKVFAQIKRADIDFADEEAMQRQRDEERVGRVKERLRELDAEYQDAKRRNKEIARRNRANQPLPPGANGNGGGEDSDSDASTTSTERSRRAKEAAVANGDEKPPIKFVSCGCVTQALFACLGGLFLALGYIFFCFSYLCLLGFAALLSSMFPSTTKKMMDTVQAYRDGNDVLEKRTTPVDEVNPV